MNYLKIFITAVCLSLFIYVDYFSLSLKFLETVAVFIGFYLLFISNKKELFFIGFSTSILWFWWIGYSFVYYELVYLIPFVILGIGIFYGVCFYILGFYENIFYRVGTLYIFSFFEPFGFNWFKIELPLLNSYFGTSKIEFLVFLILIAVLIYFIQKNQNKKALLFGSILSLGLFLSNYYQNKISIIEPKNLKIKLNDTNIEQDKKWDSKNKQEIVVNLIEDIKMAIKQNYDLVIFPETALPLVLNEQKEIMEYLKLLSKDISIVVGSLYKNDSLYYNSTYFFQEQSLKNIANKVVLVPFGEAVPLPKKIKDFINDTFYNGAKDYEVALTPTTFNVKGVKFRNAICFEATTDKIYENLDTSYVIAISNNAWFTPSIEPNLQKLLLKYYAKKYRLLIYSVSNKSGSILINGKLK